jgi:glucose-1-phosphate adenylyltransferase
MGLYVFNKNVLIDLLEQDESQDFGREIIPAAITRRRVFAHRFTGYWEDIGTVQSFFEANLDFASPEPKFNFYDEAQPIYTHARYVPGSQIRDCHIEQSLLSDGSCVDGCSIKGSVIGLRSRIGEGSALERVVMMGADYYEKNGLTRGPYPMGIGRNCRIRNAILDKDVRIGDNVTIDFQGARSTPPGAPYVVVDGIVVIPKKGVIPSGTVIE